MEVAKPLPRLLVVDDEPDILETVRLVLTFAIPDLHVSTASNGVEALLELERNDIDAVLTDYKMPGMDGPSQAGL